MRCCRCCYLLVWVVFWLLFGLLSYYAGLFINCVCAVVGFGDGFVFAWYCCVVYCCLVIGLSVINNVAVFCYCVVLFGVCLFVWLG